MSLQLPHLFDNGCVLQSDQTIRIWGWGAAANSTVSAELCDARAVAQAQSDGSWQVDLPPQKAGGPYILHVSDGKTNCECSCYIGEVFLCSGQSNMELPMAWVRANYPQEYLREPDPLLRQCKVIPEYDFTGPLRDHTCARWQSCDTENLDDFSALGYFFGKLIRRYLQVPVGLLNVSLGGSPIESWMDRDTLSQFPGVLEELEPYLGEGVAEQRSADSVAARDRWYQALGYEGSADAHHTWVPLNPWECPESKSHALEHVQWHTVELPNTYASQGLGEFRGELELRKTVFLPAGVEDVPAMLRLGTMNDADHTWVNGHLVGGRSNIYEPRDYLIEPGILHEGRNDIRVRLVIERSGGRVTVGKPMTLTVGDAVFDVSGQWGCAVVTQAEADCPSEDFVRWKPTGLYNAMLAPCAPYGVRAVLWYQGESNTGDRATQYGAELASMIGLWRSLWNQDRLPFLIVQLPNFAIDCIEDGGWTSVREQEWDLPNRIDDAATVVTLDAGEWNDLHPHNKQLVAARLFDAVKSLCYGETNMQTVPLQAIVDKNRNEIVLHFVSLPYSRQGEASEATLVDRASGNQPSGFEYVWHDSGTSAPAQAIIRGSEVRIPLPPRMPSEIRYAWCNDPHRNLLRDGSGTPITPFRFRL